MGEGFRVGVQSLPLSRLEACATEQSERASSPVDGPTPILRQLEPAEPFPVDALGSLKQTVEALHESVQSPLAMCASSLLSITAFSAQPHINVVLPYGGGAATPVSCFFVTVGRSGERKTATDKYAMQGVREREQELHAQYQIDLADWKISYADWSVQGKLGPEPISPLLPLITTVDPTIEGIATLLLKGSGSLGLLSNEGAQFIEGYSMRNATLRTAGALSTLWDGEPWHIARANAVMTITHARLSVHLQIQPEIAAKFLSRRDLHQQGLISRILICQPETTMGMRLFRSASPQADEEMRQHNRRLLAALRLPLPLRPGTVNELQPRSLPMSAQAHDVWVDFSNSVELKLAPQGRFEPISGFAAKMAEHAGRIAAVLAWWEDQDAHDIDAETMRNAIQIVDWFGKEALRLHNSGRISQETMDAEKLRQWFFKKWLKPNISIPDICHDGPNSLRVASHAKKLVKVLVDHGWLVPIPGGAVVNGVRRREAWTIQR